MGKERREAWSDMRAKNLETEGFRRLFPSPSLRSLTGGGKSRG